MYTVAYIAHEDIRSMHHSSYMASTLPLLPEVAANCTCIDKFATIFSKFDTDHSGILDTPEVVH